MLTVAELRSISAVRIEEAQALLDAGRYDGVVYLCGYAVELALKARICETLNWRGYPSTNREFRELQSFRTHNLRILLVLSGQETGIKAAYPMEWSNVAKWNPDLRYLTPGTTGEVAASELLAQVRLVVRAV